ncbi:MAG: phosphoglycerate kinase [Salibacteraceae bacterium]
MNTIDSLSFSGKKALIRVDFNVPLNSDLQITDDTRIRAALPTLKKILTEGGSVILMSHLGRPKNGPENKFSLQHLVGHLGDLLGLEVGFADDCIGESARSKAAALQAGQVLLLENLRFYKEETAGDAAFAEKLAQLGDIYVNDAFGTAHRAHASTTVVAQFFPENKVFGYLIANELKSIDKLMNSAEAPYTAIIGGAKVSSKITIMERLLPTVDRLLIGGGMAYTFIKAQGGSIGSSLVEDEHLDTARNLMAKAKEQNVEVVLPADTVIADAFSNEANRQTCAIDQIPDGWMGLDIGPASIATYASSIESSKTLLWNGPMGVFEMENFAVGTKACAEAIARATAQGAFSLVGGGDSVAAVNQVGLADQVSYVSTGGGALLEYLEGKVLPGIHAILEA